MNKPNPFAELRARTLRGKEVSMSEYGGKVVLVVNTASQCGFTPQYKGLEALHRKYADKGLAILGFPCNQFGRQEPGNAEEISQFCEINYGVTFPIFEKVDVNGDKQHPVFRWLTDRLPGFLGRRVRWNFTKFLVGRDGEPIARFAPFTTPEKMERKIRKALGIKA